MDILDIFGIGDIYNNIEHRLSTNNKINLYNTCKFIKNKDDRIFVKSELSEKDRNISLNNPYISDLVKHEYNKLALFFHERYENKNLNLSNLQINELAISGCNFPIISFPSNINKLVAIEYPYKINEVSCHYGKFGYTNAHMIEHCNIVKIVSEDSYAIFYNKKVNKIRLFNKPDLLQFINKYYSFDTLNILSTCSSFIVDYVELSRELIGKVTGNIYVRYLNKIEYKIDAIHTNPHLKNLIIDNDSSHLLMCSHNTKITKIYNSTFYNKFINVFVTDKSEITLTNNLDIFWEHFEVDIINASPNIIINHAVCRAETYYLLMVNNVRVLIYEPSDEIDDVVYNSRNFDEMIMERLRANGDYKFRINYLLTRNGRISRSYFNVGTYEIENLTENVTIDVNNHLHHSKDQVYQYYVNTKILIIPYKCRMFVNNRSRDIKIIYKY